jgi:hypothetical protein
MRGLQRFSQVQIIANGCVSLLGTHIKSFLIHFTTVTCSCYDLTVPYPSAAICEYDPYDNFEKTGIKVQADDNDIVESWSFPSLEPGGDGEHETDALVKDEHPAVDLGKTVRKRPGVPPFFNFRFPFNYVRAFQVRRYLLNDWLTHSIGTIDCRPHTTGLDFPFRPLSVSRP